MLVHSDRAIGLGARIGWWRRRSRRWRYSGTLTTGITDLLSCRIIFRLRIISHVSIRIHPLHISTGLVDREEPPHHWVIVARVIVIQPRDTVGILPCKAFGRVHLPLLVTCGAIGSIYLIPLDCRGVGGGADRLDDAAQG